MSDVFIIPKRLATNDHGRKMIVKTRIALLLSSSVVSIRSAVWKKVNESGQKAIVDAQSGLVIMRFVSDPLVNSIHAAARDVEFQEVFVRVNLSPTVPFSRISVSCT